MKTFLLPLIFLLATFTYYASAQGIPPPPPPPPPTSTTTTTPPPPPSDIQDYLDAHNKARAQVGVSPLLWSTALAKSTSLLVRYQRDRQSCKFANLTNSQYGGNQLWSSGSAMPPQLAVETWVAEKKYYTYANNSCLPGHQCGTYTQVVWRKSVELGCAQAKCAKEQSSLTICFYNPPGNVVGESPY